VTHKLFASLYTPHSINHSCFSYRHRVWETTLFDCTTMTASLADIVD